MIHPIVSANLSQARSWFFEVKIARSDRDAVFLPSHFSDILDARKQIQTKSLAKVDAISFSIAEITPLSVTVDGFIHASNQIKRGTLDRWLQHTSISEIEWRQLIGDRNCIYTELQAIKNFLEVTSPDLLQADARRLRIDYIKPGIVNRGGRPRSAGGCCSESRGPAPAGAGRCSGRGAAAAAGDASGGCGLESGGPAPASIGRGRGRGRGAAAAAGDAAGGGGGSESGGPAPAGAVLGRVPEGLFRFFANGCGCPIHSRRLDSISDCHSHTGTWITVLTRNNQGISRQSTCIAPCALQDFF